MDALRVPDHVAGALNSMVRGFRKGVKPRESNDFASEARKCLNFSGSRAFSRQRRAHMADKLRIGCAAGEKIRARSGQAQGAIRSTAHHVRIRLVLPVIQPPAHGAKFKGTWRGERPASAAEAAHTRNSHTPLDDTWQAELRKFVVNIS